MDSHIFHSGDLVDVKVSHKNSHAYDLVWEGAVLEVISWEKRVFKIISLPYLHVNYTVGDEIFWDKYALDCFSLKQSCSSRKSHPGVVHEPYISPFDGKVK